MEMAHGEPERVRWLAFSDMTTKAIEQTERPRSNNGEAIA
jgi:hypothetical protein